MLTREMMDSVIAATYASEAKPQMMIIGGYQHAIWQAYLDFEGRNWRRIKREVRKAGERYTAATRSS